MTIRATESPEGDHQTRSLVIDLGEPLSENEIVPGFSGISTIELVIPLPSFGSTNSYIDICADLLDAAWVAERVAPHASRVSVVENDKSYSLILHDPSPSLAIPLEEVALLMGEIDDVEAPSDRLDALRNEVWEFQDSLETHNFRIAKIIDHYWANMQSAYQEFQSEAPELVIQHMERFPERRLGFHRCAESGKLGGAIYASRDSWLIARAIDLDAFFRSTDQDYRFEDFLPGEVAAVGPSSFVITADLTVEFPNAAYFRSRVCSGIAFRDEDGIPTLDLFGGEGPMTSPYGRTQSDEYPPFGEVCLVHQTGTLVVVGTTDWWHLLYDARPLSDTMVRRILDRSGSILEKLGGSIGLRGDLACPWDDLDDEAFETLCYDIIFANPKFDHRTIKKMGKSRARDGGRDIEVYEAPGRPGVAPRKWIFQCKLVKGGASLGRGKLVDVGDMLDQYEAQGFGVMTSAIIDSGLYDKMQTVCSKRSVQEYHFSKLELERSLACNPSVRKRFFPTI